MTKLAFRHWTTPIFGVVSSLVDRLTTLGLTIGSLCLAGIALSYLYEIVSRYVFNAPTSWASDLVTYLLCWSIFFVIPSLTRKKAHVAITILTDQNDWAVARVFLGIATLLACLGCAAAAYITAGESARQALTGVTTLAAVPVPKWLVSAPIAFGFTLSSWYYAVDLFTHKRVDSDRGTFL